MGRFQNTAYGAARGGFLLGRKKIGEDEEEDWRGARKSTGA
jgi:hypothetical protein